MAQEQTKEKKVNPSKLADILAKIVAYVALVGFAAYGLRELLVSINHTVAYVFTGGVTLLLVYIIFKN